MSNPIRRWLAATLAALVLPLANAHAPDQSYVFLDVYDRALHGRIEIPLRDLNKALGLALPEDGTASLADVEPHLDTVRSYVRERVSFAVDGAAPALPLTDESIVELPLGQFLSLHFEFNELATSPQSVVATYGVIFREIPHHRAFLVIEDNWKSSTFANEAVISLAFEPGSETHTLDLTESSTLRGFMGMLRMGAHHIWIGIDHILFLLALLLPAVMRREQRLWLPVPGFRPALIHVIKIVTVFTIAHTITLSLAALGQLSLSSRFVESVIALSIAVAALDILVPIFRQRIWWIVFAFGLFHGFGFASILGGIGIESKFLVHSLLGFNLGVEFGQIVIVCAIFPLLYLARKQRWYAGVGMKAGAVVLIVVALYWFIERALEIDLPAGAIVNAILGK